MDGRNGRRAVPWILGVGLLAGTMTGAWVLSRPAGASPGGPDPAAPLPGGIIAVGTADSDPPPIPVGPPAVAALTTVDKVLVADGQEVKVGDDLVQFDDRIPRDKLAQAQAALTAAKGDVTLADRAAPDHALELDQQRIVVRSAADALRTAEDALRASGEAIDRGTKANEQFVVGSPSAQPTAADKLRARRENADFTRADIETIKLRGTAEVERRKLERLEGKPVGVAAAQAAAKVAGLQAVVNEAQTTIDQCLVRAKVAGTCEQVTAGPGQTFGPATQRPLLILVPNGRRVVRAEVEAEFAPRVANQRGKKVTVCDHANFALTYDGVVRQIGSAFLPRRADGAVVALAPVRVLEILIDVADPTPAGKPPLRVGQPVRVSFSDK